MLLCSYEYFVNEKACNSFARSLFPRVTNPLPVGHKRMRLNDSFGFLCGKKTAKKKETRIDKIEADDE